LCERCPLTDEDRAYLHQVRRLNDEQIDRYGPFGSMTEERRQAIANEIVDTFGPDVVGKVPGLYLGDSSEPAITCATGLIIGKPAPDDSGRIARLRIRNPKRKYSWVSSSDKTGGIGSGAPLQVVWPKHRPAVIHRVAIAEGEFKGIAVAERLGLVTIVVPGCNIISDVVALLNHLGVSEVVVFYDMDALTNESVAFHENRLITEIIEAGYTTYRATWPVEFKGIDDSLDAGVLPILEPRPIATPCLSDTGEKHQLNDELAEAKRTISNLIQTMLNPHMLQSEKLALVSAINLVEEKRREGKVRPDGAIELSAAEIADDWRAEPATGEHIAATNVHGGKPRMNRQHVKPIVKALSDRGFISATPRSVVRTRKNGSNYNDTVWDVTPFANPSEPLSRAAQWRPDEPKERKPRAASQACLHCGEVHPIVRYDYCAGCAAQRTKTVIQPVIDPPPAEPVAFTEQVESPAPYVPKISGDSNEVSDTSSTAPLTDVPKISGDRTAPAVGTWTAKAQAKRPLDSAKTALAVADHAPDRKSMRQANTDLRQNLGVLAHQRGRSPVPKPSQAVSPDQEVGFV